MTPRCQGIALRYDTKVFLLKAANKLLTDKLFAKRAILVPPPDHPTQPPPGLAARPLFLMRARDAAGVHSYLLPEMPCGPPPAWDRADGFLCLRPDTAAAPPADAAAALAGGGGGGATCVGSVFAPAEDCVITRCGRRSGGAGGVGERGA